MGPFALPSPNTFFQAPNDGARMADRHGLP